MSTFACHCGGTITGTSAPDPERNGQPNWTFVCDGHQAGAQRTMMIAKVMGDPGDNEEARMMGMKQPIDANEQWFIDNPTPSEAAITSTLVL